MNRLQTHTRRATGAATNTGGGAVVLRGDKLTGYRTLYTHGHTAKAAPVLPPPVIRSAFQRSTNYLSDARFNDFLFRAGGRAIMQPNLSLSFKSPQLTTPTPGSPAGSSSMQPAPRFSTVNPLTRARQAPRRTSTRPAKS